MNMLIQSYKDYLNNEEKSSNTIEKYMRDIGQFMLYLDECNVNNVQEIAKENVIAYKNKLISENYAARSINSMLASISSFLRYVGREDCLVKNIRIQRQIYCSEEQELTKSEYLKLLQTAENEGNMRLSLIMQTICSSGIRVGEL